MGVDEGNPLVMGVERYILKASSSYGVEINLELIARLGLGSDGCR